MHQMFRHKENGLTFLGDKTTFFITEVQSLKDAAKTSDQELLKAQKVC